MKSIKKLKKYGTAVAGTALLVGATLTGAAAQTGGSSGTTLGDYPAPFVDDDGTVQSSIVVGEDAATADVVGAIDIAGSLSQAAFTTTSSDGTSGGSGTSVSGVTETSAIRGTTSGSLTAFDYDTFTAGQMDDEDGNPHFVTESAAFDSNSNINGTSPQAQLSAGDVSYTVDYSPGFEKNDTITLLGTEYELTNVDSNEVTLGSTVTESELELDGTYTHGPYTVKVEDFNQDQSTVLVQVSKDGESVEMTGLGTGDSMTVGENNQFEVNAESIYFGSQANYITIASTYTDTTLTDGEAAPMDEDYDVSLTTNSGALEQVQLTSQVTTANEADEEDDVIQHLDSGDTFAGPGGYFDFVNVGLTSAEMTDVNFKSDQKVSFDTPKGTSLTVNMNDAVDDNSDSADDGTYNLSAASEDEWIPLNSSTSTGDDDTRDYYAVKVTNVDSSNSEITLEHGDYSWTVPTDGAAERGAPGFQIDINSEGNITGVPDTAQFTTQYGAELTMSTGLSQYPADVPVIRLNETAGDSEVSSDRVVDVVYDDADDEYNGADDGEIAVLNVTSAGSQVQAFDTDGDTGSTLTDFGSTAQLSSSTSASVSYASSERKHEFGLGEVTEGSTGGGDGTSQEATYGDTFPSTGALDTDESIGQVKENDNVILVGGPAINDLTAELATENQTWDANEWQTGGHEGTSILQVTEGFDGEGGNKALVVAGHAAEDTRTAADFLANYGDHSDALSGESMVEISTETGNVVE